MGKVVPGAGLEPARPCGQGILSPLRLPFRHPGFDEAATYAGFEEELSTPRIGIMVNILDVNQFRRMA